MSNVLSSYLNKRLKKDNSFEKDGWGSAGPVITISREVGCNGIPLANLLAEKLNEKKRSNLWKVLSKEVFHQSAQELNMEPETVKKVFKQSDRYIFDEILKAFNSKSYKSERKIVNTVTDVVRSFAIDGFCIIVGRASHIIASDIKNALHIRLTAPLDFRIKNIQINNGLNREEAQQFIQKVEKERIAFRKTIKHENLREELFDVTLNRASYSNEKLIEIIELAFDKKEMMEDSNARLQFY